MTPGIAVIPGLGAVADRYDAFLVDLWGCLHNGIEAFPEAVAALGWLRPKPVCLLSNGPRRASVLIERLDGMGIGRDLYDAVMSSGESAWAAIKRGDGIPSGRRCHHIGSGRDLSVREGNGVIVADRIGAADFILCTDIRRRGETLADYEAELACGVRHGLPMVCANPDLVVHVGDRLEICAGTLAARYAELGGRVSYHGKPHPAVYSEAFRAISNPAPSRTLAIGDGLRTDIAGADASGMDSLFLADGIHGGEVGVPPDPGRLARRCAELGVRPTHVSTRLVW